MMSATLSAKRKTKYSDFINIVLWSIKKHKALPIVYASLLLFSSPVIGTLATLSIGTLNNPVTMLTFATLSTAVTMIMTFIIAVMMFDYLHNKRQADVFGSLPCTRRTLFFSRYATGLIMILVPYIINMLIVALMSLGVAFDSSVVVAYGPDVVSVVFQTGVFVMLSVIASYSFTAFMAVCCGTTANTVLTTLLVNFAYPIAISMLSILGSSVIPGVNLHIDEIPLISNLLSPYGSSGGSILSLILSLFRGGEYNFFYENWQQLVVWAILISASVAGCFFLTKKRKTEAAQNSFAFKAPSIIIRFIATAAIGLLFGLIFTFSMYINIMSGTTISGNPTAADIAATLQSNAWTMFAIFLISFFIAAFLTHLVATVIFNKGFNGFGKSLISFAAVVVCVCLLYTSLAFGGFGADKYIPQSSEISSVEITSSDSSMLGMTYSLMGQMAKLFGSNIYSAYYSDDDTIICNGEESINAAVALHEKIIKNLNSVNPVPYYISTFGDPYPLYVYENYDDEDYYDGDDSYYMNPSSLKLIYHMKNGTTVERSYSEGYYGNIYMTSELENIEAIASKENSAQLMSFLSDKSSEITSINIMSKWYGADNSVFNSKNLVDEMKKALFEDMNNDAEKQDDDRYDSVFCKIIVRYRENDSSEKQTNISVPYSYKNSVKLLSQYGYTTSLNLIYDYESQSIGVSQFFLDGSGMLSKEAAEQYFTLPENISTDYLESRTTEVSNNFYSDAMNSYSVINYDMYYYNDYIMYDYDDAEYSEEENGEQIIDENKLSFKVVYADDEGNLYYYNDKCSYADLYDSAYDGIVLHHLTDNNDKNKVYYPFVIQAYSDEEKIYTTPVNISENNFGNTYYVSVDSKANIKEDKYVFLTAG